MSDTHEFRTKSGVLVVYDRECARIYGAYDPDPSLDRTKTKMSKADLVEIVTELADRFHVPTKLEGGLAPSVIDQRLRALEKAVLSPPGFVGVVAHEKLKTEIKNLQAAQTKTLKLKRDVQTRLEETQMHNLRYHQNHLEDDAKIQELRAQIGTLTAKSTQDDNQICKLRGDVLQMEVSNNRLRDRCTYLSGLAERAPEAINELSENARKEAQQLRGTVGVRDERIKQLEEQLARVTAALQPVPAPMLQCEDCCLLSTEEPSVALRGDGLPRCNDCQREWTELAQKGTL